MHAANILQKLSRIGSRKLVRLIFLVVAIGVFLIALYLPNYTRLKRIKAENERLSESIDGLKKEIDGLKVSIEKLETDPFAWERLARKNLGMIKKGEPSSSVPISVTSQILS